MSWQRFLPVLAGVVALAGCASPGSGGERIDPIPIAGEAVEKNRLVVPVQVVFTWSVNEPSLRANGRGVARMEPPNRSRLDLFAPSGETVAVAALVGGDLRLPPGTPDVIPPSALLWSVLGVFHPGADAVLLEGRKERGVHYLLYRLPDGFELRYALRDGLIERAELLERGHAVGQVVLTLTGEEKFPSQAVYRDLTAFRELRLNLESVEHVAGFSAEIWLARR